MGQLNLPGNKDGIKPVTYLVFHQSSVGWFKEGGCNILRLSIFCLTNCLSMLSLFLCASLRLRVTSDANQLYEPCH